MNTSERHELKQSVCRFVYLQEKLLQKLSLKFDIDPNDKFFLRAPSYGCVDVDGESWLFKKHGQGFKFKSWTGVIVDAHREINIPGGIDAWRLAQFLESVSTGDSPVTEASTSEKLTTLVALKELASTNIKGLYRIL